MLASFLLFLSCASHPEGGLNPSKKKFSYSDVTGTYSLTREHKSAGSKIVTRSQLSSNEGSTKILEKSITVSQAGVLLDSGKKLKTLRPFASEFTVWLEGKKYLSKMKLNVKKKSMTVQLESPEEKWNGLQEIPFPKGQYFCFYTQIPECLYLNNLLRKAKTAPNQSIPFIIIWDPYPFIQEQMTNVGKNLFAPASVKFDGEFKNLFRYIVEVEGQIILYHFTPSFELIKAAWIAQGISIVPPGEEVANDEE
ncbi:MAG TPA: hypothetical protein VNJ01_08950 [Bacteriovoracaceae bacterium]|nr:hypothetical protein [Bacteriovoracaceae bacterium]